MKMKFKFADFTEMYKIIIIIGRIVKKTNKNKKFSVGSKALHFDQMCRQQI